MIVDIEKLHEIANIENATYVKCGKHWITLEEQLEMAVAFANENFPADIEWYERAIADRDSKISASLAA